jgi:putative ABC transport system ATP-binding protein
MAAGLLRADTGTVSFEGRDLAKLSKRDTLAYRREKLGFVFQAFNLAAGLTAAENVSIALLMRGVGHANATTRALALLGEVGLADRAGHTPDRLSGGEQQRVAIARALVGDPALLLADEPTGNLDSENGTMILELLSSVPRERGAGAILVTHDPNVARYADRVLVMRDGRLSENEPQRSAPLLSG